jgi:hypothetical protein
MLKNAFVKIARADRIAVPAIVLILVLLAYGLLAPWLGFYWDDWPFAWFLRFFGPSEFIEAFRPFRPLLGPVFMGTTALFGGSPVTWQLVGLAVRVILSLELWLTLRLVWPSQKWNLMWVVLLFTVYPGYRQQWVSLTHVNQELIPLMCLVASFGVTAHAVRNGRHEISFTILALLLQALGLFSTEYFFGLEILRGFFLAAIFSQSLTAHRDILKKTARHWLPYLCVWILNAAWTYAYHNSEAYRSYGMAFLSGSSLSLPALGNEVINVFSLSVFTSWLDTFGVFSVIDGTLTQIISLVILLCTGFMVFAFMLSRKSANGDAAPDESDAWSRWAMIMGLAAVFGGRLPSWAAGLPLKLEFDYDRFMLSIMLGASLFIVGLATYALKDGRRKIVILSLLIALSTAYQFNAANTFRREWANQRDFFWQLAWRAPAVEPNTVLLTSELPFNYVYDLHVTAPLNWMYAPSLAERRMPYVLLYIKTRLRTPLLPSLQPDQPVVVQYRTAVFSGSTSDAMVLYKDADGCLRVLDPVYGNAETVPGASDLLVNAIPLSDPARIRAGAPEPQMDPILFGPEPAHGWCYFYEKAELARQQPDWDKVVKLFDQAAKSGLVASAPVENLVFIEGLAISGRTNDALELTDRTLKGQKELCPAIYSLWDRASQSSPGFDLAEVRQQIRQSGCLP